MRFFFLLLFFTTITVTSFAQTQSEAPRPYDPLKLEKTIQSPDAALGLEDEKPKVRAKSLINSLYKSCIRHKPSIIEQSSLEALCGCTAANAMEIMSDEEIVLMSTNEQGAQFQRERLFSLAYLPCMQFPVGDIVRDDCLSNINFTEGMKKPATVCSCIADNMAQHVVDRNEFAVRATFQSPEKDATVQKILMLFLESYGFKMELNRSNKTCVYTHEYGWD